MLRRWLTLAPMAAGLFVACGRSWLPGIGAADSGTPLQEAGAPDAPEQVDAPVPSEAEVPESAPPVDASDASPPPVAACPNAPGLQAGAPWPTMRRCPGRAASSPFPGPRHAPSVVWSQTATTSWGPEPVIAADGTVYAIDWGRGLVALTPGGAVKWTAQLSSGTQASTTGTMLAIGADGTVYVVASGRMDAFAPDGTERTRYVPFCEYAGINVNTDGSVELFGAACGMASQVGITLVSLTGGALFQWSTDLALKVSLPSYGPGDDVYFQGIRSDGTSGVFALVPRWSVAWSVPTDVEFDAFDNGLAWPVVRDDGSVVFVDGTGLHALSPSGTPLWTFPSARPIGALAAGHDGTVYAGTQSGGLVVIAPDGGTAWAWGGANGAPGRPIVDGAGTVYAATSATMVAIAAGGSVLWQTNGAATPLAIDATGTLYALDGMGKVLSALR